MICNITFQSNEIFYVFDIRNTSIDGFLLRDIGNPEKFIDQVQIRYLNTDGDIVAKPLDKLSRT